MAEGIPLNYIMSLYDLMDSAYDAPQIKEFSEGSSHVPIINPNPRREEKVLEVLSGN